MTVFAAKTAEVYCHFDSSPRNSSDFTDWIFIWRCNEIADGFHLIAVNGSEIYSDESETCEANSAIRRERNGFFGLTLATGTTADFSSFDKL